MAKLYNRVKVATATTSTGTVTLGSASSNAFCTFAEAGVSNGDTVAYCIEEGTDFEVGTGVYTSSGTTLSRAAVTISKIGGTQGTSKMNLAGAATVRIVARAEDILSISNTQSANAVLAGPGSGSAAAPTFRALVTADLPLLSWRNILCANGGLEVWQRGAGDSANIAIAASTTAYTADRWYIKTPASCASHVSAQAGLTTGSRLCARIQRDSGQTGTGTVYFEYPLTKDECAMIAGSVVTLSMTISTGANWSPTSGTLNWNLYCGTGTEGKRNSSAYTSETNPLTGSNNFATTAAATRFTGTSSAVASTTTQAAIQFSWAGAGTASTNDWFSVDDVQLEVAANATTFERLSFREEHALCRAHYEKSFPYGTAPVQNGALTGAALGLGTPATATGTFGIQVKFSARMRGTPTITLYNPSASNAQGRDVTASADGSSTTASNTGDTAMMVSGICSVNANTTTNVYAIHYQADAGL